MTLYGTGQQHLSPEHGKTASTGGKNRPAWIRESWIKDVIELVDAHLDEAAPEIYRDNPLANTWRRFYGPVSEAAESQDALVGMTGGNPRKGVTHSRDDLLAEAGDTAVSALLAIQSQTKDIEATWRIFLAALDKAESRVTAAESAYHPDPEISAEVATDAAGAERADLAAGFPVRRWRCLCGTEHSRGHFGTIGVHRCLACGYNGTGGVMLDENGECG